MISKIEYIESQLCSKIDELEIFPKYINIETKNVCNARCVMCAIDFDSRPSVTMKDEVFNKITDELKKWSMHIEKVNLYLDNEPLLDRSLHLKIKSLKAIGIKKVAIASNASALTIKRCEEIVDAGLDEIYIALDSTDKKVYESIRVGLSFDRTILNIRNLIAVRKRMRGNTVIRLQMIDQCQEPSDIEKLKEWGYDNLGAGDQIVLHKLHNWGNLCETVKKPEDDNDNVNDYPCTILWSNLMIHADGRVALCTNDIEIESEYSLGNVVYESLNEIWHGNALTDMRRRHLGVERSQHLLCDGCTSYRESNNIFKIMIP